jgi:hypothetical protein
MAETIAGEVIHVVEPSELDDYELEPELKSLAESRYILVCRKGGSPSWIERIAAFVRRDAIEPVTVVSETVADEGQEVTATVIKTELDGVYEATELR